jgi:hypothetical protein
MIELATAIKVVSCRISCRSQPTAHARITAKNKGGMPQWGGGVGVAMDGSHKGPPSMKVLLTREWLPSVNEIGQGHRQTRVDHERETKKSADRSTLAAA